MAQFQQAVAHFSAGRLAEAELLCREVLTQFPTHADAWHLLGVIALRANRADLGVDFLQRAVEFHPTNTEARCNLAHALRLCGRPHDACVMYAQCVAQTPTMIDAHFHLGALLQADTALARSVSATENPIDAIRCYQRVLTLAPNHIDAQNNLGVALLDAQRFDEATVLLQRLVTNVPGNAIAHFNLGNLYRALAQFGAAITHYRRALEINPHFVDAIENLGTALYEIGDIVGARRCIDAVLAREPDAAITLANAALVDLAQGQRAAAFDKSKRAIAVARSAHTQSTFVQCATGIQFQSNDAFTRELVTLALCEPWCRPYELVSTAVSLIRCDAAIDASIAQCSTFWPAVSEVVCIGESPTCAALKTALADNPLLHALLVNVPAADLAIEIWLTHIRRELLKAVALEVSTQIDSALLPFYAALASQCFINGYVYALDDHESAWLAILQAKLRVSLQSATEANDITTIQLVTLGCYVPLHHVEGIEPLIEGKRPAALQALVALQVHEPRREATLKQTTASLTAIAQGVSSAVQAQYESDPYPRWLRPSPIEPVATLDVLVRRYCPSAPVEPMPRVERPLEILIAGCGTGQHAIETARQHREANVLAIDLSLSSLAYAQRQTEALAVRNIRYAHADIALLDGVDIRFDLIESVGVLHHMAKPLEGWRTLRRLLRPGGLMRLGLYSALARQHVVAARTFIHESRFTDSHDDIRRARHALLTSDINSEIASRLKVTPDFFSMSECRDLLFHVQEHRFTLPDLATMLEELGLHFIGFTLAPDVRARYAARFPDDVTQTDLGSWHVFETENPDTFAGMYQFFAQAKS